MASKYYNTSPGWKITAPDDLRIKGSFYAFVIAIVCLATAYFSESSAVDLTSGIVGFIAGFVFVGLVFLGGNV